MTTRLGPLASAAASSPPAVYAPTGWDSTWKAALAASRTTPCWVSAIGDSVACGFQSTDYESTSWFGLLSSAILARGYPLYGTYYPAQWYSTANCPGTPPFTMLSTGLTLQARQYGYTLGWTGQTAVMPLATFVAPFACTALDILWYDNAAGTQHWEYAVDGGAATTVTATLTNAQKRTRISGLSSAVHTLTMGNQNSDLALLLSGVAAYSSLASGVGFARAAFSGMPIGQYGQGAPGGDLVSLWQGTVAGGAATGFGFPTQPALFIIAQGINDCGQGSIYSTGPLAYENYLRRFVQAVRRGANASVILLGYCNPDTTNSDVTSGTFPNPENWFQYLAAMQRVAQHYNCAFVNIHARWGETPVARGYISQGNAHPNNAGHADIASVLASIV